MCLTLTDYEIPNGPKFQDPRMSAYSPYLKESMIEIETVYNDRYPIYKQINHDEDIY